MINVIVRASLICILSLHPLHLYSMASSSKLITPGKQTHSMDERVIKKLLEADQEKIKATNIPEDHLRLICERLDNVLKNKDFIIANLIFYFRLNNTGIEFTTKYLTQIINHRMKTSDKNKEILKKYLKDARSLFEDKSTENHKTKPKNSLHAKPIAESYRSNLYKQSNEQIKKIKMPKNRPGSFTLTNYITKGNLEAALSKLKKLLTENETIKMGTLEIVCDAIYKTYQENEINTAYQIAESLNPENNIQRKIILNYLQRYINKLEQEPYLMINDEPISSASLIPKIKEIIDRLSKLESN